VAVGDEIIEETYWLLWLMCTEVP